MKNFIITAGLLLSFFSFGQSLTVATWNIEHLGSSGRGFPEYGNHAFDDRTAEDFQKIAALIKDTLSLEIVAVQEIASTKKVDGVSYSDELKAITSALGSGWSYYLANFEDGTHSDDEMQNAFIYNEDEVELSIVFEMEVPDYKIGDKNVFDRKPLVGYFVPKNSNDGFVLVNVHLASGQDNDENHLAAMVMIEQNLQESLIDHGVDKKEKDIIILGDFNDDPFKKKNNGTCCMYSNLLYQYMAQKGYTDMVDETFVSTRMSKKFNSIIDHMLVSKEAKKHITQNLADIYHLPDMSEKGKKRWRAVYSDHFPVYVEYEY